MGLSLDGVPLTSMRAPRRRCRGEGGTVLRPGLGSTAVKKRLACKAHSIALVNAFNFSLFKVDHTA